MRTLPSKLGRQGLTLALMLGGCWGLLGCSSGDPTKNNIVRGRVVFSDGTPLPGGDLHLTYTDGKTDKVIPLNADGSFSVKGMPLGKVKVWVRNDNLPKSGSPYQVPNAPNVPPEAQEKAKNQPAIEGPHWVPVPSQYTSAQTTPWEWEITAGTNDKEFTIQKK